MKIDEKKIDKKHLAEMLLKRDFGEDFDDFKCYCIYSEFGPNVPDNIEELKKAKAYLFYCKQEAEKFLERIKDMNLGESELSQLDYDICLAETNLKYNEKKFYKAFALRKKLKQICEQKISYRDKNVDVFVELIHLLTETERQIIQEIEHFNETNGKKFSGNSKTETEFLIKLEEKLGVRLPKESVNELLVYWSYYKNHQENIEDIIQCINEEKEDIKWLRERADENIKYMLDDEKTFLIYKLLPESDKTMIRGFIYYHPRQKDLDGRFYIDGVVCGMIEAFLENAINLKKKASEEIKDFGSDSSILYLRFVDSLIKLADSDDEYNKKYDKNDKKAHSRKYERLLELAKQLV